MHEPQKILNPREAVETMRQAQTADQTVVMCHGCFDIVHPGHIRHLKEAARYGDRLLVSITGDAEVGKGDGRPLIPQELRLENLAALDCVDWVTVNEAPTAVEMLQCLKPDVYVKGREYEDGADARCRAERDVVESYGGRVVFSSGDVVFSSTALISAMEDASAPFQSSLRRLLEQHNLGAESVAPVLSRFAGRRVLVVGETIIDTYVQCDRPRVAGESPMMTLRPIDRRSFDGGAAIIARQLAAMGARPILVTALPRRPESEALRQRLEGEGVEVRWLEVEQDIPEKQRFLVGSTKVMKLDLGDPLVLDARQQRQVIDLVAESADECEALIISDYGQGLFSSAMLKDLCITARPRVDLMVGDVSGQRSSLLAFQELDLICPSEVELRDALHNFDEGLTNVVWQVLDQTRSRGAMITLGEQGLIAFGCRKDAHRDDKDWRQRLDAVHVPTFAPYAIDQLGCGDSLLAAATLTLCGGGSLVLAAVIGTVAASAQAQRLGNAVIGSADLRKGLQRLWDAELALTSESRPHPVIETNDQLRSAHA